MRIGHGYDVHRLVENRSLVLGGVEIPHTRGLLGHSDADVLSHAVSDALLGAVALGDIGQHFPDSDEQYKGASSLALLKFVVDLLVKKGYAPYCLDSTLQCQDPKLAPFIPKMRTRLAEALGLPVKRVSVKATTTEGLGFVGRKEGIAAHAVVLVNEID
jgi:2-C-methyl-D-erythritol 2,4-cyclodiphosphate synthase